MCIRFFILQAHYRSPLDFSNEALQAAEKGLDRLFKAINLIDGLKISDLSTIGVRDIIEKCENAMNDDLNSPILIAHLFDGVKMINSVKDGKETINSTDQQLLKKLYTDYVFDILGLQPNISGGGIENGEVLGNVVHLLLNLRVEAKKNKDWATSDKIRNSLTELGFVVKDTKDGFEWELKR
jgi:cysteinyl-tRNA synthetase